MTSQRRMTDKARDAPRLAREKRYRVILKPADDADSVAVAARRGLHAGEANYLAAACPYTAPQRRRAWFAAWLKGLATVGAVPPVEVARALERLGLGMGAL